MRKILAIISRTGILVTLCSVVKLHIGCDSNPVHTDSGDLRIVSPAPGAQLLLADTLIIRWVFDRKPAKIGFSYASSIRDSSWKVLSLHEQTETSGKIVLPEDLSGSILLRLTDSVSNISATVQCTLAWFVLLAPAPVKSSYKIGDTVHIAWRMSPLIAETVIQLVSNRGRSIGYITGGSGILSPQSSYDWVIGGDDEGSISYPAIECKIRCIDYMDDGKSGETDGYFDIGS